MIKKDSEEVKGEIFALIFIIQNRLQTYGEKVDKDLTMKQWLLLAVIVKSKEEKTLTELGNILGCSRQNIKKIASTLEKKGYIELIEGKNNSIYPRTLNKINEYGKRTSKKQTKFINELFSEFNDDEITELLKYFNKLQIGLEKVKSYTDTL